VLAGVEFCFGKRSKYQAIGWVAGGHRANLLDDGLGCRRVDATLRNHAPRQSLGGARA
jgi:hypothetical protein